MEEINCIVIDDEPLARKGLIEYINDVHFLRLAGDYDNAMKATDILGSGGVQLIFLDIQMPKLSGIEFLKTLHHPPPVIFTTAYPQFALDGYDLNAIDYLVKPISFERFMKAAMRVKEYYEVRQKNRVTDDPGAKDYFFIKADNKLVKIFYDEILFVEALQNYVAIHTVTKKYITYLTFKSIEEYLDRDQFVKTHKSYIVAASRIDQIDGNTIRIGEHQVPISRSNKEEVMDRLLKGKLWKR